MCGRSSGQILPPNFNMSVFRLASLASQNTRPNPTIYNVNDCLLLRRRRQVTTTLTLTLFPSPSSFQSGTSLEFQAPPPFQADPQRAKRRLPPLLRNSGTLPTHNRSLYLCAIIIIINRFQQPSIITINSPYSIDSIHYYLVSRLAFVIVVYHEKK